VIEYLREKYYIQENNFNSVPAETNTFLPTNKNLTNQQGTKKTQKNSVLAQHRIIHLPSLFRFLERKKKKKQKILLPATASCGHAGRQLYGVGTRRRRRRRNGAE
jgi:hypothetical protein